MFEIRACVTTTVILFLSLGMIFMSSAAEPDCALWTGLESKQDCRTSEAHKGKNTLWWDSLRISGFDTISAVCCNPGSFGETLQNKKKDACLTTKCVTTSRGGLCPKRELPDGTILTFEEVLRDECVDAGGWAGVVAQCCLKNSTEGMLLSTMGAELGEFPHQVGIASNTACGGTVYNRNHVLTAAHCVIDGTTGRPLPAGAFTIQVGTTLGGHFDFDSKGSKFEVEQVIHHPDYSKLEGKPDFPHGDFYNDIALLRIKGEFNFSSDRVKSLELAPDGFVPESYAPHALIVGWGTTDNLELSAHLQKGNARLLSDDECFSFDETTSGWGPWTRHIENHEQLMCAGGIYKQEWSPSTGEGDSGGPAICRGPTGNPVLCGITSYGSNGTACGISSRPMYCFPSVFAEVEYFRRNWADLLKKAGPQDPSTFFRYKLYGDEDIPADSYLHQVHITSVTGKPCGGTLIAKNLVLTAASCVSQVDGVSGKPTVKHSGLQVFHGVRDLADLVSHARKELTVQGIVVHDDFERVGAQVTRQSQYDEERKIYRIKMTDNYHKHDLALIQLGQDVDGIEDSQLAKLPLNGSTVPSGMIAVELALPRDTKYGTKMRSREFKFVPRENCQERLRRLENMGVQTKLDEDILCAVERYSGGSTCDRELGGGLICKGTHGEDLLCGVQVFRLCEHSIPNGFIDVAKNLAFVDDGKKSFGL